MHILIICKISSPDIGGGIELKKQLRKLFLVIKLIFTNSTKMVQMFSKYFYVCKYREKAK